MVAIVKTPTTTVERAGPIQATPPAYPPVIMARVPTAWTSAARTSFPTNGPRYNQYEMAIIAESDQTLWNSLAEAELARIRGRRDGMTAAEMTTERAKLRAWHATYKAWAVI